MNIKNKSCSIYNMEDNVHKAILLVIHFIASYRLREFLIGTPLRLKTRTSKVLVERGLMNTSDGKKTSD